MFHLDLCEAADGRCFVLGWAVRSPNEEPDVALLAAGSRHSPLTTFQRPDVIEYLTHTSEAAVGKQDLAFSFVFAVPAGSVAELALSVQGAERPLEPVARGPQDDLAFLVRYLDALLPLDVSPAVEAARAHLHALSGRLGHAAPQGRPASVTLADLRDASTCRGPIFEPDGAYERLAILAIHQRGRWLTPSHSAMLGALRARGWPAVVVNSCPGSDAGLAELEAGGTVGLLLRPDHGRDFASWLVALSMLGPRIGRAREMLFCNDSFFGPFDDLDAVLTQHAHAGADAWALTDSWERGWHLQSSFFILSARALASEAFAGFRVGYAYPDIRDDVVMQGEIGLSRALVADRTLRLGVLAPYSALARRALDDAQRTLEAVRARPDFDGELDKSLDFTRRLLSDLRHGVPRNPQHVFWEALLTRHRIPFVKRELLNANPAGLPDYWRILGVVAEVFGREQAMRLEEDMRAGAQRAPVGN